MANLFVESVENGATVNLANVGKIYIDEPKEWAGESMDDPYRVIAEGVGTVGRDEGPSETRLFVGSKEECEVYDAWLKSELRQAGLLIDPPTPAGLEINLKAYRRKLDAERDANAKCSMRYGDYVEWEHYEPRTQMRSLRSGHYRGLADDEGNALVRQNTDGVIVEIPITELQQAS